VRCDLLGNFEFTAVLEVGGNAGCPEAVIPDLRQNTRIPRVPANHAISIRLTHGLLRQHSCLPLDGAEQEPLGIRTQARSLCFGPRTACAGLTLSVWPTTEADSQGPDFQGLLIPRGRTPSR